MIESIEYEWESDDSYNYDDELPAVVTIDASRELKGRTHRRRFLLVAVVPALLLLAGMAGIVAWQVNDRNDNNNEQQVGATSQTDDGDDNSGSQFRNETPTHALQTLEPTATPSQAFSINSAETMPSSTAEPTLVPQGLTTTTEPSPTPSTVTNTTNATTTNSIVLAFLPDTQYYSEGAPYIFTSQTRWLAQQKNIVSFVLHLGDVIQTPNNDNQWQSASRAMSILEAANVTYSMAPGNHDLLDDGSPDVSRNHQKEDYLTIFGADRAANQTTFGGRDPLGYSEYHLLINTPVTPLLVLALDWRVSDETIAWAQSVLDAHPNTPTILTTHEMLFPNADGTADFTTYGAYLWNSLIRSNNQIFFAVNGHFNGSGHIIKYNDNNRSVSLVVVDFQDIHAGGNGYLRLVELDFENQYMEHLSFSPFVMDLFKQDGVVALSPQDIVELTSPPFKYKVPYNLTVRIEEITNTALPAFQKGGASRMDPVRLEIASVPPPLSFNDRPRISSLEDYPIIAETLAHWRFEGHEEGTPVDSSVVVEDITGWGNDLMRVDVSPSQPDYLTWSDNHHPLSASNASICFSNPSRDSGSFLSTVPDSPLSFETFPDGYTVEAFARLTNNWSSVLHRWTAVVSRRGEGQDANKTQSDVKEPLAHLGFSPSREAQWATFPNDQAGMATSWSSPVEADRWVHLAAVHDGQHIRLYVDGYPARRDPYYQQVNGLAAGANLGWSIGSSTYDGRFKIFGGCIGEVRIVGRALAPNEFLIARSKK